MHDDLDPGLYELLITTELESRLARLESRLTAKRTDLHAAEAANRIALHLGQIVERAIDSLSEKERVRRGVRVAREVLALIDELIDDADTARDAPIEPASILRSVLGRRPDGSVAEFDSPQTPLVDTTLLTNAPGEPRVGRQVKSEIDSANRIDVLIAFVRRSGLTPLEERLRRHCERGRRLRVLTTTYTGSTERKALDMLQALGAEVRVSYDTKSTRLHAKAWLFHRGPGFSTAFIGSSNLTYSAQVSGLEWNVRVSAARNPDVIDKVGAVFDSYWESGDFRPYDPAEFDEATENTKRAARVAF